VLFESSIHLPNGKDAIGSLFYYTIEGVDLGPALKGNIVVRVYVGSTSLLRPSVQAGDGIDLRQAKIAPISSP